MVDKSELAIASSQTQNPIPFKVELLFNLLYQMITVFTIKLTCQPVSKFYFNIGFKSRLSFTLSAIESKITSRCSL